VSRKEEHKRDTLISAGENREMFDRIAGRYDLMNKVISLGLDKGWRRRAIRILSPEPNGRYLDVGAGTGDLMLEIARTAPGVFGVGLDPAKEMMAIGKDKVKSAGQNRRIFFCAGNAMTLPFGEAAFDGVILGFCIRNVEHRKSALAEFHRVLKPGKKLVILELTAPRGKTARLLHGAFTNTVVPAAAFLLSLGSAYRYLTDSVSAFPPSDVFEQMIQDAGFRDTGQVRLTMGAVTIFFGTA
jgi:demethylmenaquinone methyltransferase/2-methoxy-6-polyprenyl-1,4-benzoquinol methylase